MDLSAVIFVVLALAWAVYLIPKALAHHDEMASDRLIEGHSDRVRVLRRRTTPAPVAVTPDVQPEVVEEPGARDESTPRRRTRRTRGPRPELTPTARAARRRRRVLALLTLAAAVVAGLAYYAIVPWAAVAGPGAAILLFFVVARVSVRRAQRTARARRQPAPSPEWLRQVRHDEEHVDFGAPVSRNVAPAPASRDQVDLDLHDPAPAAMAEQALADEGSLWDPLPMTLPTYVNKARARRTVRTIELTGMQSSGHDSADSDLAREAGSDSDGKGEQSARRVAGA